MFTLLALLSFTLDTLLMHNAEPSPLLLQRTALILILTKKHIKTVLIVKSFLFYSTISSNFFNI